MSDLIEELTTIHRTIKGLMSEEKYNQVIDYIYSLLRETTDVQVTKIILVALNGFKFEESILKIFRIVRELHVGETMIIKNQNKTPDLRVFDEIHLKLIKTLYLGKLEDLLPIMDEYNYPDANRGILRTILVTLKPYRKEPVLAEMFTKLADILRAGSTHGVI